jgi:outer membrane protein assembly factor BamB
MLLFVLCVSLVSCGNYPGRGPNSTVKHTFIQNSFASVVWSKDNIMMKIDQNSTALVSAPNRIIASAIQPKVLYAFDTSTGEIVWEQNGSLPQTIAIHDAVLYTSDLNIIQAYNVNNGERVWEATTHYAGSFLFINFLDDKIFLYSSNNSFFILDSYGRVLKSTEPYYFPMPYIVGDDVTYAGDDYGIVALETKTGNIIWRTDIEEHDFAIPYFSENNIYLRTGTSVIPGSVYAIDKNDGEILWKNDSDAISNLCFWGDNLYFLTWDGYLMVLNQETGLEVAKLEFSPRPFILPTAEWRLGGYYVTSDPINNVIAVSLGDSYQLLALKINNP